MPKSEHSTFATTLDVTHVKNILSSVLSGARIDSLNQGPLDEDAALAILASQQGGFVFNRSPFGPGNAVAQIIVEDHGASRSVELIAIRSTFVDGLNVSRAKGSAIPAMAASRRQPNKQAGRKMVEAVVQALRAADPSIRQTE